MIPAFKLIHNASQDIDQVQRSAKLIFDYLANVVSIVNGQLGLFQDGSGRFTPNIVFQQPQTDVIVHHRLGHAAKWIVVSKNNTADIYESPNNVLTSGPGANPDPKTCLILQMQPGWSGIVNPVSFVVCQIYVF